MTHNQIEAKSKSNSINHSMSNIWNSPMIFWNPPKAWVTFLALPFAAHTACPPGLGWLHFTSVATVLDDRSDHSTDISEMLESLDATGLYVQQ